MGLRLQHKSFFLTDVLAPLCGISNFNYEQVNPRNFPSAMLLCGKLVWRKPLLRSPSSGLVHRAFPIVCARDTSRLRGNAVKQCRGDRGQSAYGARPPLGFYFVTNMFLVIPEI